MTEHTEHIEPPQVEILDIPTPEDEPTFHPILMIWQKLLEPAASEKDKRITPQYASRITANYRDVSYGDMPEFRDRFYGKVIQLQEILNEIIASDPDCLSYTTPEEDVEHNSKHYRTLLLEWQKEFLRWEMAWDTTSPTAGVELAATGEVHNFFFSQTGISAYLEQIGFQYTEDDQAAVQAELVAMTEGGDGE